MPEMIEIVEITPAVPLRHQLGKLFVATLVAFAATKLAERAYDVTLTSIQSRNTSASVQEG